MSRRSLSLVVLALLTLSFSACTNPTAPKPTTSACGTYQGSGDC
jgi:hypothetical protein